MEPKPVRITRSRRHKQVSPNGLPIQYVGRPGKWGNPFKIETKGNIHRPVDIHGNYYSGAYLKPEKALDRVLELYEEYLKYYIATAQLPIYELRGKNLSCWCGKGQKCHADILLKYANKK